MDQIYYPIVFSMKEFNKKCKEMGINPFPIEEYSVNDQQSAKRFEKQLTDWLVGQSLKKINNP